MDDRLAPQHRWSACAEDVGSAIKRVKAYAADSKADVNRIAIIGEATGETRVAFSPPSSNAKWSTPSSLLAGSCPFSS